MKSDTVISYVLTYKLPPRSHIMKHYYNLKNIYERRLIIISISLWENSFPKFSIFQKVYRIYKSKQSNFGNHSRG